MARRNRDWMTDIAFADVAMALLGPILLLLVVFVLYAAKESKPPECRGLSPAEITSSANALRGWLDQAKIRVQRLSTDVALRCGDASRAIATGDTKTPGELPAVLAGLCVPSVTAVLAEAKVTRADFDTLAAERQQAELRLAQCTDCRRLTDQERRAAAAALTDWLQKTRTSNSEDVVRMQRDCPERLGEPVRDLLPASPPPAVAGLCTTDREAVLAHAGVSFRDIDRLEMEQRVNLARLRRCEPAQQETVEVRQNQLQFAVCDITFVDPVLQQQMEPAAVDSFFQNLAREVQERLLKGRFNRVDIFGHSDSKQITRSCRGAQDNQELSSLRAQAFRRALEAVIHKYPEFGPLSERLKNRQVRIYAIGVGDAEPKNKHAIKEEDHAANRRIELRFASDRFGKQS